MTSLAPRRWSLSIHYLLSTVHLYFRYINISVRSQMQYRLSFLMAAVGQFVITGSEIIIIWALFDRFGSLRGWLLAEVALFYGIVHVAFSLSEAVARGFDTFDRLVRSGDFDRLLLRPRGTIFQVSACEMQLMRVGGLAQGLLVLLWAMAALDVHWTPAHVALLLLAIFGGVCLFCGLFVIQATLSFWTTQSLEVMNTVTYGGAQTGQFPIPIYRRWFQKFFTFVVPLACVTYFPMLPILGRQDVILGSPAWFHWCAPLTGVAFLLATLQLWKFGVRHYRSTGS